MPTTASTGLCLQYSKAPERNRTGGYKRYYVSFHGLFHFVSAKYSFASSDNDRQGVWPVTIFLSAHSLSLGSFRAKSTNLSILIWDMSRDYNLRMCSILNGNQPTGLWVRRLACGCDPGGVTSRDFSTSLEMTRSMPAPFTSHK